ncbi:hypothetical protein H072_4442 [Dactylellina haptotyla CBS 200.50]|uniref:Glycosyltransferase family 8 protein n=1 Tax=Dactylellina haptotyla (strain CBS 200.50) TaxID=1284197 RepID=S8BQB8_DACHA|nr:hypothetical protein H072_4442 [Dactylellina haptotyla CBS 200.50]
MTMMVAHATLSARLAASLRQLRSAKSLTPRQAVFALVLLLLIWTGFLWTSYPALPAPSALRLGRLQHYGPDGLPEVRQLTPSSRVAYATFLAENTKRSSDSDKDDDDMYFVAARVLAYQLLHDPDTRSNRSIPFIVLVTAAVSESKRRTLESDGATVIFAEDVTLPFWVKTGVTRWKDQFTKLRLFELVEYERIVFIDADTLLTRCMDGIFDDPAVKNPSDTLSDTRKGEIKSDEGHLPRNYVFSTRPDNALNGERSHPFPPIEGDIFSAGFWVAAPSFELFDHYYSVMNHWRRFNPHTMEQSLLNYAHRIDGAMPWGRLDYKWSATWPNHDDLKGGVASLHEKFWSAGEEDMRRLWYDTREKMEKYWSSQG